MPNDISIPIQDDGTREEPAPSPEAGADDVWQGKRLECPDFRVPIFLSYSSPGNTDQYEFTNGVYRLLKRNGLMPRTLGVNEYDADKPLKRVRRMLNTSHGLLTIAFARTEIEKGRTFRRLKEGGSTKPAPLEGIWLSSPWVHIEAAMAYQCRLPILILRQDGVEGDGLLEAGVINYRPPVFTLGGNKGNSFLRSADFIGNLRRWESQVRAHADGDCEYLG